MDYVSHAKGGQPYGILNQCIATVPEPSIFLLFGTGAICFLGNIILKKRKRGVG